MYVCAKSCPLANGGQFMYVCISVCMYVCAKSCPLANGGQFMYVRMFSFVSAKQCIFVEGDIWHIWHIWEMYEYFILFYFTKSCPLASGGQFYFTKSCPLAEKELSFSEWRTVYLSSSEKRSWLAIL